MTCVCDVRHYPLRLVIPAGLSAGPFQIARALGIFPDWRTSTLAAIGAEPALDAWRAREPHDLGLMLVEMGAYVFDVCDFYDALVAGEGFLKTAQLTGAQRKLVAMLGYLPRPAIASGAYLAAHADGRQVVALTRGTAFRSGAFGSEPPQVFELTHAASIDPRINAFSVSRVPGDAIATSALSSVLVDPASVRLRAGDPVVIDFDGTLRTSRVASLTPALLRARTAAARLTFNPAVAVPAGAKHSTMRVLVSGGTRGLWKLGVTPPDTETAISASGLTVLLGALANIAPRDVVLFEKDGTLEARRVSSTIEQQRTLIKTMVSTIKSGTTVLGTVESPPITVAITAVTLDAALAWASADAPKIVVHHPLSPGARVLVPLKDTLAHDDAIVIPGLVDAPRTNVSRLLLQDLHEEGVATVGSLDATTHTASIGQGENWGKTLTAAVTLHGNVLEVSRGETVADEILGTGDGSQGRQTFKLKKKPLTYLAAATPSGFRSTLDVRVGGILWHQVESFYGADDTDRVYTVRHDDDGEGYVTFGGGSRLPSGAEVTADYRFGAGRAIPPAGSITQLARPVPGINSVRNVLPAFGGDDAESPRALSIYAPRSALLLGRAVSLPDLEVAAATVSGVRAARAQWRWDDAGLRAVAEILYIGSDQLRGAIRARLRALVEPDAPISVVAALPQPTSLAITIDIHPDHDAAMVIAAVREALYGEADLPGTGGMLRAEQLGPEGILFLSHVAAAVMAVDGVTGLKAVSFNGVPFAQSGRRPSPGHYFAFGEPGSAGRLLINGAA